MKYSHTTVDKVGPKRLQILLLLSILTEWNRYGIFATATNKSSFIPTTLNVTTLRTTTQVSSDNITDPPAANTAILDIAYYLRSHKFNEYDRRYETNAETAPRDYYRIFPKPPLRSLHWEVNKFCEDSFQACIDYLHKKIIQASLRRHDDTSVVIIDQKWKQVEHSQQINQVDDDCKKLRRGDDILANPFEGPIERFQWRTTASYYMCLYTMKGEPLLKHFNDRCDNFAYCLDRMLGPKHGDPRARDELPFGCAMYSFCPDPCCVQRHIRQLEQCWETQYNPCYQANPPEKRQCLVNRTENIELRDLILNRWNVTCSCPQKGFRWNSLYGICVDVDECATASHNCDQELEACVNLEGGYRCACKWGHAWDADTKRCSPSPALSLIKLHRSRGANRTEHHKTILQRLLGIFSKSVAAATNKDAILLTTGISLLKNKVMLLI